MKNYIAIISLALLFSCKKEPINVEKVNPGATPVNKTIEITVNSNKFHPYLRVSHNGTDIVEYNKGSNVYNYPVIITYTYTVLGTGDYKVEVAAGKSAIDSTFDINPSDNGAIWSTVRIKKNGAIFYDQKITLNIPGNPGSSQHLVKVPF